MFASLRRLLSPPVFPDDDLTRRAGLLHPFLLVFFIINLANFSISLLLGVLSLSTLGMNLLLFVGLLTMILTLRRGYVGAISFALCVLLWVLFTVLAWVNGGLYNPNHHAFMIVLFVAGILLGGRGLLLFGLMVAATLLLLFLVQLNSPTALVPLTPPSRLIVNYLTAFAVLIVLLWITNREVLQAFARARQNQHELTERNRQLLQEIAEREAAQRAGSQLRDILDATSDFVGMTDPDGRTLYLNPGGRRLLGIGAEENIGHMTVADYHPAWAAGKVLGEGIPAAIRNGIWMGETALRTLNGQEVPASQVIIAHKDAAGRVEHFSTTIRDISEMKRAESARRMSETRLLQAQKIAGLAVWEYDLKTGKGIYSDEAFRHFGLDIAPVAPSLESILTHIHPDDLPGVQRGISESIERGNDSEYQFRVIWPDGQIRYLEARSTVETNENGERIRFFGVGQDITERKQAEQERLELALERERTQLLRDFLGNLSHDLKTPLTAINTSLYLLEKYADPEQKKTKLEDIRQHAMQVDKIIQDILHIARLEHEPLLDLAPLDVNKLLQEAWRKLSAAVETKNLVTQLKLGEALPTVLADRDELYRMFINLMENAINYTPEGGRVEVKTFASEGGVVAQVTDTGIGIDPGDLPRIFTRFYRSGRAKAFEERGTGLGLAIVKRVVEIHNGRIEVSSQPGQGSTFRVWLPAAS